MLSKPPPSEVLAERIGEVVGGRYRLDALIGVGGQGAVYRAHDLRDRDEVAVKVLHEAYDSDPSARERLLREAHALMATRGTAAVTVLDQVFTPDGRLSLVTELMVGESLEDALVARDAAGVRFSLEDLRFVFEPLVSTITRAHENHIVHRDLKPGNVFLDRRDGTVRVRLMDFGFARLTRLKRLTAAGFVAGSPSYIAPEVWLDQPATELSDVYALGAMMFRAFGGRPPFESTNMVEVFRDATTGPRPSLAALRPDLPRGVDDWVAQALAVKPSDRFWTPMATYQALAGTLGGG